MSEDVAHIEVRSIYPTAAPLPIAKGGYYANTLPASIVTAAGGPVAYVDVMLAAEGDATLDATSRLAMTRPLSHEERLWPFRRATCSMQGASERWAQRTARGLTNEQLAEALRYELGIYGGCCGPNSLSVSYQGAGLKIWASWEIHNTVTDAPAFKGAGTIATARQVYCIRNPDDKQLALF